jgi:formylglycine-generating enzyme required for sulfatase activity
MVVLDACRDNPFGWARSGSRGLSVVSQTPRGSIVMYATGANSVASDGTGKNGLFTSHLLSNLKTAGLSVFEVFDKTMGDVSRVTGGKQEPELSLRFSGAHTVFLGTRPAQNTPVQPAPAVQPAPVMVIPTAPPQRVTPGEMVQINGGTFTMGSPANESGRSSDETQHQVTLSSFYIGKYEVTQKEYQEVMGNPSRRKGDNLPVENVSWYDTIEYCNALSQKEGLTPAYTIDKSRKDPNNSIVGEKLKWVVTWNRNANGYRLPTEAEWEYACRAGTNTPFNTGGDITTTQANYNGKKALKKTTVVGSFEPNAWGLYDMHGNVREWCWDWYGNDSYTNGDQTDPIGAVSGSRRVARGGGIDNIAKYTRSAFRGDTSTSRFSLSPDLGFRVVRNQGTNID